MNGRAAVFAALALAASALAGCAKSASTAPDASPAAAAPSAAPPATGAPSGAPSNAPATSPPVNFHGERVGSNYVYATKRKNARTVYALRADSVNAVYNGALTGVSNFTNPHVVFYGNAGKQLIADAPAGTVVEKDKSILMTGGVRARTADKMTLTSDTLRYDDEDEIVHGVGHVIVGFPTGEELRGETVDWDLRDGQIKVGGAR